MTKLALIAALMLLAAPVLADPAEGVWKTRPDDNGNFGHVRVAPCGDRICGVLIKAFDATGAEVESPNVGRQIIWDMVPQGDGSYADGQVYAPDRDKTYNSKMQLNGDKLGVKGCVLGICRDGGSWTRVN